METRYLQLIRQNTNHHPPQKHPHRTYRHTHTQREAGIICVKIYDDLALEAWTQRKERANKQITGKAKPLDRRKAKEE